MQEFKFMYDDESDSLLVYREDRNNNASIKFGEIIVDLDRNLNISAVEIMNPDLIYNIPKDKFAKISDAYIQVQHRGQVFWIFVVLKFEGVAEEEKLPISLQLEQPISV